ncbi:hypothetical protein CFF01_12920 [Shewanella marisflavi]|uniref:Uncharacterized protein n=1 Tax=Shewanella marisflavi TaxID=260364 RepID=A0AAC9TYW8_9GAMM|nr:hypothetical protein CFF01_12920 [Shewanella marisflavi]
MQRVTNVFAHKACGRQLIHYEAMVKASLPMAMPANVKHPFQATALQSLNYLGNKFPRVDTSLRKLSYCYVSQT